MIGRHSIIGHRRSLTSLERDPLLPPPHHPHHDHRPSQARRASLANITANHEEGEVSVVELFSDLVVVVALHNLSDMLGEGTVGLHMYFFQVLLLWCLWHNCILMMNLANIYTANEPKTWHHIVVFTVMGSIVFMTTSENPLSMLIAFWVGRAVQLVAVVVMGNSKRPVWVDHEWHENMVNLCFVVIPFKALLESVPLLVTLSVLQSDRLVLLGGVVSAAVGIGFHLYSANMHDVVEKERMGSVKVLDVEHLTERHELVVLILFGELCFAAASSSGAYYMSLCTLLTVFGCFLLYFATRVPERQEPWTRSAVTNALCQYFHLLLMGVMPLISVGFTRLILHAEGKEDDDNEHDGVAALHFATAGFLWVMGLIDLIAADPENPRKQPRWRRRYRLLLRFAGGCIVALLYWLPRNSDVVAATIAPSTLLTVAAIEMWAVQLVDVSLEDDPQPPGLLGRSRRLGVLSDNSLDASGRSVDDKDDGVSNHS